MSSVHTKIFVTNRTQAVRLPKKVAMPENIKEVDIVAIGNTRIITPTNSSWDSWFETLEAISEDFLPERNQPEAQIRENL